MNTADFFNLFKLHRLGKKRSFGSYRVIDGDHCQVLVRARTSKGVPKGSELVAVTFNPKITLFCAPNLVRINNRVIDNIQGEVLRITDTILDDRADNLLDSGIIDIDEANKKMLIEIGDTPWLFEYEERSKTVDEQKDWKWDYNVGSKLSVRCSSIAEALVEVKPKPNIVHALGWTLERMPDSFSPDALTPADKALLSKGVPNPMDYGFEVEHCKQITTFTRGAVCSDQLGLRSQYENLPGVKKFKAAIEDFDEALKRYTATCPDHYEDISTNHGSVIILVDGIPYVKGELCKLYTSRTVTLNGWHKLVDRSNKVRLQGTG